MITSDWVTAAAKEIYGGSDSSPELIAEVIEKHCPFKQGVAYQEVESVFPQHEWSYNSGLGQYFCDQCGRSLVTATPTCSGSAFK